MLLHASQVLLMAEADYRRESIRSGLARARRRQRRAGAGGPGQGGGHSRHLRHLPHLRPARAG